MSNVVACLKTIKWTRGRQVGILSLILLGYLLIGAAVFEALEKPNEEAQEEEYRQLLTQFVNESGLSNAQVKNFTAALRRLSSVAGGADISNWSFAPAFFFALTVVTTIGYGQISPVTAGGQAFCCVFALLGIPIAGVLLIKLADILKSGFNRLRDSLLERVPKNPLFSDSTAPLYIALVGVVIFMFIPAVVFFAIEDWTYGQSLYYCFITLSTIGFGDFVPAQSSDDNRIIYKLLTMVWVFVGLAFLTLLLEIVNDLFSTTVKAVDKAKEDALKRLKSGRDSSASSKAPSSVELTTDSHTVDEV